MTNPTSTAASRAGSSSHFSRGKPLLVHGMRVAGSVILALAVSYSLELENGFWSGITATVVCLPSLGSARRKGRSRVAGTIVGAAAMIFLEAAFPQNRFALLIGLALWCGICSYAATVFRNFGSYGAALAGYTAAVIFADAITAPGDTFTLALTRTLEICIGVASVSVVLVVSDAGGARARLAAAFADVASTVARHLAVNLGRTGEARATDTSTLVRRVIALDAMVDEAYGEAGDLRTRAGTLHAGIVGMLSCLAASEDVASQRGYGPVSVVGDLVVAGTSSEEWLSKSGRLRAMFEASEITATETSCRTSFDRAIADQSARAFAGLSLAANSAALIAGEDAKDVGADIPFVVSDWLPACIDGLRAVLAVLSAELFWVETNWAGGQGVVTITAVAVTLFPPLGARASSGALDYCVGTVLAYVAGALTNFAVLPCVDGFPAFALALAFFLVPMGAACAVPWRKGLTVGLVSNYMAILSPSNQPVYDQATFLNSGMAVVLGAVFGAIALRVVPPLSASRRARRLVALSLRDMRRLAAGRLRLSRSDWLALTCSRVEAMPLDASPNEIILLMKSLSVGSGIVDLRALLGKSGDILPFEQAFLDLGRGRYALARERLEACIRNPRTGNARGPALSLRRLAAARTISAALS